MDKLSHEMTRWRINYRHRDPTPYEEIRDTIMLAVLCFLLYVLVVVIFATPDPVIQDEAQTAVSQGRN